MIMSGPNDPQITTDCTFLDVLHIFGTSKASVFEIQYITSSIRSECHLLMVVVMLR